MVALCILTMSGCSESDIDSMVATPESEREIPAAVIDDFTSRFPDAEAPEWKIEEGYAKVSFQRYIGASTQDVASLWYELASRNLKLYATQLTADELPAAVVSALSQSEYGDWSITRVSCLRRSMDGDSEMLYMLNVAGTDDSGSEVQAILFYTPDGILVLSVIEESENPIPDEENDSEDYSRWYAADVPGYVADYMAVNYPGARCIFVREDKDVVKVKILDGVTPRLLVFDSTGMWKSTVTELEASSLPQEVRDSVAAAGYDADRIEKATEYDTSAEGIYYMISVKDERGKKHEVKVWGAGAPDAGGNADGSVDTDSDDTAADAGDVISRGGIEAWIEQRYPGCELLKKDYSSDGLTVKLSHGSARIEVEFAATVGGYVWKGSDTTLSVAEAPECVAAVVESRYAGYELYYLSYIESASDGEYYEAGIKSASQKRSLKVLIDTEGNVLGEYSKH